jgi:hypothetical protein
MENHYLAEGNYERPVLTMDKVRGAITEEFQTMEQILKKAGLPSTLNFRSFLIHLTKQGEVEKVGKGKRRRYRKVAAK